MEWPIDPLLAQGEDYRGNQLLAQNISVKGYDAILEEYVYITPSDIKEIISAVPYAWDSFHGQGIDLGGGVACISSTIACKESVENIICVEVTEDVVRLCQPVVISTILGSEQQKVTPCIGDFNNLHLGPQSIDFAVAWGSLHHSYQLVETLIECKRVLKPDGNLIVVERAHDNSTTQNKIEDLLNIEYPEDFLRKTYRDPSMRLTRRDNGEHEYRYDDWSKAFRQAGFEIKSARVIRSDSSNNVPVNDAGIPEVYLGAKLGGFLTSKVGYLLSPSS